MTTKKSTTKKVPVKKAVAKKVLPKKIPLKKAVAKKTPVKKAAAKKIDAKKAAATKIERIRQHGKMLPLKGSKAGRCWDIADKLAKKAGAPPKRSEVVELCVAAGLSKAGSAADFQGWRKYHGLVAPRKAAA